MKDMQIESNVGLEELLLGKTLGLRDPEREKEKTFFFFSYKQEQNKRENKLTQTPMLAPCPPKTYKPVAPIR